MPDGPVDPFTLRQLWIEIARKIPMGGTAIQGSATLYAVCFMLSLIGLGEFGGRGTEWFVVLAGCALAFLVVTIRAGERESKEAARARRLAPKRPETDREVAGRAQRGSRRSAGRRR
jgi:hypothetical protein